MIHLCHINLLSVRYHSQNRSLCSLQGFREIHNTPQACAYHADVPVGHVFANPYPHLEPKKEYSFVLAGWSCCGKTLDSIPGKIHGLQQTLESIQICTHFPSVSLTSDFLVLLRHKIACERTFLVGLLESSIMRHKENVQV